MASIPQPSHPWAINLASGDSHRVIPATSRTRITITHVFLVDTATAGVSLGAVHACVEVGPLWHTVASLSAESPFVVLPDPIVLNQEFTLYVLGGDPSDEFIVEIGGYEYRREECHDDEVDQGAENEVGAWSPDFDDAAQSSDDDDDDDDDDSNDEDDENSSEEEDEDGNEETEIGGSEDYDNSDAEDFEYSTEEEEEEEEEEESHGDEVDEQAAIASSSGDDVTRNSVPCEKIVGAPVPCFASVGSTAGFMRVTTVESQEEGDNGDKEISILYRCTHFSAASGEGVQVRESTMTTVYQLRFVIPPAGEGDTARYLLFAGVSLPLQVYPARYSKRLHTLWSSLIAEVSVPTQPARVEVLIDFGIIRTIDRTPKRMERMRAALEGMVGKDFHPEFHLEFQLPESAKCGTNEDCTVCFELLEGEDLVTWPGCSKPHVFHGSCLELVLKRSDKCPICRNLWSVEPKRVNIRKKGREQRQLGQRICCHGRGRWTSCDSEQRL